MPKLIYVDIINGTLQGVYGDRVDDEVEIVLRDWDNILAGDEDPVPEGYEPEMRYW